MKAQSKAQSARQMWKGGACVADIALALNMARSGVYEAIKRKHVSAPCKVKTPDRKASTERHNVIQPWGVKRVSPPRGECVAWVVENGKAVQCGAPCEGQRCQDHPQGVAHTIRIGARTGGGLAA